MILRKVAAASLTATLALSANADVGDWVQDNLDFISENSLSNVGGIVGGTAGGSNFVNLGRISVRTKTSQPNLITFVPPSASVGKCGNIDLQGGSFSFISGEEIVSYARNVAANALGYAFYLAIESLSSTISSTMKNMQETMQKVNGMMLNSCEAAQAIVSDPAGAAQRSLDSITTALASGSAYAPTVGDAYENKTESATANELEQVADEETLSKIKHNVTWKTLKTSNVGSALNLNQSSDTLEGIMSLVGSIIVLPPENDTEDYKMKLIEGNRVTISHLVYGGDARVYKCDTTDENGCLAPSENRQVNYKSNLEAFINEFTKDNGIIDQLATNGEFSASQRSLFRRDEGLKNAMQKLVRIDSSLAKQFLADYAERVVLDTTYQTVLDAFRAVETALKKNAEQVALFQPAFEEIERNRSALKEDYERISDGVTQLPELNEKFMVLLNANVNMREAEAL